MRGRPCRVETLVGETKLKQDKQDRTMRSFKLEISFIFHFSISLLLVVLDCHILSVPNSKYFLKRSSVFTPTAGILPASICLSRRFPTASRSSAILPPKPKPESTGGGSLREASRNNARRGRGCLGLRRRGPGDRERTGCPSQQPQPRADAFAAPALVGWLYEPS